MDVYGRILNSVSPLQDIMDIVKVEPESEDETQPVASENEDELTDKSHDELGTFAFVSVKQEAVSTVHTTHEGNFICCITRYVCLCCRYTTQTTSGLGDWRLVLGRCREGYFAIQFNGYIGVTWPEHELHYSSPTNDEVRVWSFTLVHVSYHGMLHKHRNIHYFYMLLTLSCFQH
jgi:hypothetical protein